MNTRNAFNSLGNAMRAFGSAIAAAGAVERGQSPKARDLRNLGIDPRQFDRIGRI